MRACGSSRAASSHAANDIPSPIELGGRAARSRAGVEEVHRRMAAEEQGLHGARDIVTRKYHLDKLQRLRNFEELFMRLHDRTRFDVPHQKPMPFRSCTRRYMLVIPARGRGRAGGSPRGGAAAARGLSRHPSSHGQGRRHRHLLPRGGPADAPVVVLLHGFPTSSHMFRNLIPALAERYRVIAPDYPAFGQSGMPDRARSSTASSASRSSWTGCLNRLGVEPLRALRAGLRRAGRVPPGAQASRAYDRAGRAERQRLRGGARSSGTRSRRTGPTVPRRIAPRCARA